MKKLKLKNAKLELLTKNKVSFIGELKGYRQKFSMTITNMDTYEELLQLDENSIYNIWFENNFYRFIAQ